MTDRERIVEGMAVCERGFKVALLAMREIDWEDNKFFDHLEEDGEGLQITIDMLKEMMLKLGIFNLGLLSFVHGSIKG